MPSIVEQLQQLATRVSAITASPVPDCLHDDPVLETADDTDFYIVGLIGGKEVGKSALINALSGQELSESTAYGEGTGDAITYVHESREAELRSFLDDHAPGHHRLITHNIDSLQRQVLMDLPDIDSIHDAHVTLTQHMLRHILFPVWVQSVEKYADM